MSVENEIQKIAQKIPMPSRGACGKGDLDMLYVTFNGGNSVLVASWELVQFIFRNQENIIIRVNGENFLLDHGCQPGFDELVNEWNDVQNQCGI